MEFSRARSLEKPLKLILFSSNLSSLSKNPSRRSLKTLALSSPALVLSVFSSFVRPTGPHLRLSSPVGGRGIPRPLSSLSPGQELDLKAEDNQQQSQQLAATCPSDDEGYQDHLLEVQQEKQSRFIPVKAFFLCTSIDLRSLQAQNAFNVIPPNSRATNYVVLRYYDVKGDQQVLTISEMCFCHMGLSDQDIVALSGAHTLGRCRKERSGFEGGMDLKSSYFR